MTATAESSTCQRRGRGSAVRGPSRGSVVSATDRLLGSLGLGVRAGRPASRLEAELRAADDLQIRVLERRRMGPNKRQGRLDRSKNGVGLGGGDIDAERTVAGGLTAQATQLGAKALPIVGVDLQPLARERGGQLRRRSGGDD